MKTSFLAIVLGLALAAAACATSGTGTTPSAGEATNPAAAAIAAKLGVSEKYVGIAMSAAQSALGGAQGAATATADAKEAAAKEGVDKAASQAQADGAPLNDDQKSGLLDSLKGVL